MTLKEQLEDLEGQIIEAQKRHPQCPQVCLLKVKINSIQHGIGFMDTR